MVAVVASWACGHAELPKCEGKRDCACYPNDTCDTGLACVNDRCRTSTGQGGTSSTGGTASGSSGTAGASAGTGTGGSTAGDGSGGTGGTGTGGTDATGGTTTGGTDTGGTNATGGTSTGGTDTGGTTSTGGTATGGTSGSSGAGSGGGTNLITNGDFSNGENDWNTDGASAMHSVMNGVWCAQALTTDAHVILGWPGGSAQPVALSGEYTFSFKMSLSGNATINAKVGQAVSPYAADFEMRVMPTGTLDTVTYMFSANDPQAGVAFDITGHSPPTTVCIDDVVLARR